MEVLTENTIKVTPFVKWAGGKAKLIPQIEQHIFEHLTLDDIDTYVEPFIGGGALFFYLCSKFNIKNKVISDVNKELINCYQVIKENHTKLLAELETIQIFYNSLEDLEEKKEHFYYIRSEFNKNIQNIEYDKIQQAVYFIYLNKIGFNGLYRVNKKGLFNVPFGQRIKTSLFDKKNIENIAQILKDTTILHGDYQETRQFANKNTLFYFDPPYRPISTSSSFTSYTESSFNDKNQIALKEFCDEIKEQGAKIVLSNSDPIPNDPEDTFFDDLFKSYDIFRIQANRAIGAKGSSRGKVSEILVIGK